jgi:hypothetical protein
MDSISRNNVIIGGTQYASLLKNGIVHVKMCMNSQMWVRMTIDVARGQTCKKECMKGVKCCAWRDYHMKLNFTKVSIFWGLLNVQSGRCVIVRHHHTPFMQYIYIIEFELIAPFQAHIKNFIHVISQKKHMD